MNFECLNTAEWSQPLRVKGGHVCFLLVCFEDMPTLQTKCEMTCLFSVKGDLDRSLNTCFSEKA